MAGWSRHRGQAVALPLDNVDTDQLIPARFMSVARAQGYADYLLHDLRREGDGALKADFPLNAHERASILVAGANFGSGSSREAAVYALVDAGFRAVIAPGFGDIFASNAVNNGLLPARVDARDCAALTKALDGGTGEAEIDLEVGQMALGDLTVSFALEDSWRAKLMNGWDDIDLTHQHSEQIEAFKMQYRQTSRWAWPRAAG